ncbi:MAG: hypothetical protein ACLR4Z_07525 [Butyricicoccaceae bacterium]
MYGLLEHPEYLQHLPYKKRKKIEQLLATTAQNVQPDELSLQGYFSTDFVLWQGYKTGNVGRFSRN